MYLIKYIFILYHYLEKKRNKFTLMKVSIGTEYKSIFNIILQYLYTVTFSHNVLECIYVSMKSVREFSVATPLIIQRA